MSEIGIQISEVRGRRSDVKDSTLRAENCRAAKLVRDARTLTRKTPPLAVGDVGLRPVMTRAKVRSEAPNNKAFNVKLS